jgi:hypothetical protein
VVKKKTREEGWDGEDEERVHGENMGAIKAGRDIKARPQEKRRQKPWEGLS